MIQFFFLLCPFFITNDESDLGDFFSPRQLIRVRLSFFSFFSLWIFFSASLSLDRTFFFSFFLIFLSHDDGNISYFLSSKDIDSVKHVYTMMVFAIKPSKDEHFKQMTCGVETSNLK